MAAQKITHAAVHGSKQALEVGKEVEAQSTALAQAVSEKVSNAPAAIAAAATTTAWWRRIHAQ